MVDHQSQIPKPLQYQVYLLEQIPLFSHSSRPSIRTVSSLQDSRQDTDVGSDSGQLTEKELRAALVNGDYTAFDPQTVRMMIKMFDTDRSGSISFEEFW
jgi:hypothetical protein